MAGSVTKVFETITSVEPSAGARATRSAPSTPEAPGRFSTTMVGPSAGPSSLLTVRASTSSVPPAGNGTMKRICLPANGEGACAKAGAAPGRQQLRNSQCATAKLDRDAVRMQRHVPQASCARSSAGNRRRGALDLHAEAGTHVRPIVPDRLVVRAAVIPERDRMRRASGSGRSIPPCRNDRSGTAGCARPSSRGSSLMCEVKSVVDEDHLLAGDRMPGDDRMHRDRRAGPEDARAVVGRGQARQIVLHARPTARRRPHTCWRTWYRRRRPAGPCDCRACCRAAASARTTGRCGNSRPKSASRSRRSETCARAGCRSVLLMVDLPTCLPSGPK